MKIAVNGWFLEPALAQNTGTGQYLQQILAAIAEIAPDVQFDLVEPVHGRGDLAKVRFEQQDFPRAAERMHADLAFVPHWGPPLSCRVPVVSTIHDVIQLALPEYRGGVKQRAYFSLARAAAQNARAILTDSEFSKADITRYLAMPHERVHVAPLAVDERFTPAQQWQELDRVRELYQLPERYVLYLGGFDPRKNIETLFQVYTWAGDSIGEEYPLVVTGNPDDLATSVDGQQFTLAQMCADLQVDDCVRFIGRPADADKPALYAMARAFLYPTRYEGFGLPALEAMASGVPVVGSNATSVGEIVGAAGSLVDPLDSRAMAGALIAVCIQDDLHARLRQRSLLRAAEFTWQRTAYDTLSVFRAAVKHKPA